MYTPSPWWYPARGDAPTGRVVVEHLHSAALEGNRLGDPATRDVPVYLPPGYDADSRRGYPVVYWLHGFTGTGLLGLNYGAWSPDLPQVMDAAIAATGQPAICVLVDGWTRYGGSQYLNSSLNGRYEEYVVEDVVRYVDAHYRTVPEAGSRAVAGKSSGGYGAFVLGLRHPDVFGLLCSVSGDCYFELCYKPDFPKLLKQIAKYGSLEGFLEAFQAARKKSGEMLEAINIVAMAAAYSPNPESPVGFDLPFDPYTGELRPDVWARWEALDPVNFARELQENARRLRLFYFECGTKDEFNLQYGARILHARLEGLGIPHEHLEFDDGHMGINYRYPEPLGRVLRAFDG